ncbi:elongation factor G [Candidatus Dojkabacteria bacterium]|uniref:Elongation factor G n=1 Tax=Candidatus Dojkabacteria bacterium TaxID=2099670 RepID=A0A955HYL3_9BACT|nr:elongation factor G [Candidatus Dojkabacteria bacterium]MCB9790812.1 elongation factor G [Candidatus Nomurabacteria bacterium]
MARISYDVKFPLHKIRNIGIIAHIDAGKTTTTERLLYHSGQIHKVGEVHDGETVTDYMEQEKERGITIVSAAVTCFWKYKDEDYRINIIDTPGHVDFTAEVERSLRVLDSAVVIFDGKMGVEPQSETVWRQADKYGVPRMCFVNKLNLLGGDFEMSMNSIKERLTPNAVAITLPIGREQALRGIINLLDMKAYTYKSVDQDVSDVEEIPADLKEKADEYRRILVEKLVEQDDTLMEKYLSGEDISVDELIGALRKGTISRAIFPVMGGDSRTSTSRLLLDAIIAYLASPIDLPPVLGINPKTEGEVERKPDESDPFSGLVFKIVNDPHVGNLAYFRIYSGRVDAGSYVYNSTKGEKERIGRLVLMHAEEREEVKALTAGDIGAIIGLKDPRTGDTLCDESNQVILEQIQFAEPVVSQAIEPKTKSDEEKMSIALNKLSKEDPTLTISSNHETGQTIISGMGELHLEVIVDRMKREFSVEVNVGRPQVAYRETIKELREQEGKYIKQSGGKGQYGHCWLRLEPGESGSGFEFVNEIKGGSIPREFIPAIQKGVEEAMKAGVVAGYPVVDVKVSVYDGSYHEVDSSEAAFKVAGSMAFKEGMRNAKPVLLEPVMSVEVSVPEQYVGDITGSLNSKRGMIIGTETKNNLHIISANVPLAELFGYTTELRSITSGRGVSTMEMSHYAEVPKNIAEQIAGSE